MEAIRNAQNDFWQTMLHFIVVGPFGKKKKITKLTPPLPLYPPCHSAAAFHHLCHFSPSAAAIAATNRASPEVQNDADEEYGSVLRIEG